MKDDQDKQEPDFLVRIYLQQRIQADGEGKSALLHLDVDVKDATLFKLLTERSYIEVIGARALS